MNNSPERPRFIFFGTPRFAAIVLDALEAKGYLPALVVTAPDKPKGRRLVVTPSEVKIWAQQRHIPVLTPEKLRDGSFLAGLKKADGDLFIVAAYGKIIPKSVLDMPRHGTLNVHPSLLPKFRGPSPVESAILSDETQTGVTIIVLDLEVDHGPIVAKREHVVADWPPKGSELADDLARLGGALLAESIPHWIATHHAEPQDDARATFTKKITKEDGMIDLAGDPRTNYKKVRAFDEWPGTYFFTERNGKRIRVRITDASLSNNVFTITRVVPEGKKEMSYADFLRGAARAA